MEQERNCSLRHLPKSHRLLMQQSLKIVLSRTDSQSRMLSIPTLESFASTHVITEWTFVDTFRTVKLEQKMRAIEDNVLVTFVALFRMSASWFTKKSPVLGSTLVDIDI